MCNISYCNEKDYTEDGYCKFHSFESNIISYIATHLNKKIKLFQKQEKDINKILIFTNMMEYIHYKKNILLKNNKDLKLALTDRIIIFNDIIKRNYDNNLNIIKKFNIFYKKMCLILNLKNI